MKTQIKRNALFSPACATMTMLEMCLIKICCAQAAPAQGGRKKEGRESEKQIQIKLTNAWRRWETAADRPSCFKGHRKAVPEFNFEPSRTHSKKTENSICPKDCNYKYFCGCCHKWKFQLNTLLIFIVHPKSLICPLLGLLRLLICLYLLFFSLLADGGHRWADQRTAAACNRFRWWWRLQYGRPQQNEGNALLFAANRHGQRWVVRKDASSNSTL